MGNSPSLSVDDISLPILSSKNSIRPQSTSSRFAIACWSPSTTDSPVMCVMLVFNISRDSVSITTCTLWTSSSLLRAGWMTSKINALFWDRYRQTTLYWKFIYSHIYKLPSKLNRWPAFSSTEFSPTWSCVSLQRYNITDFFPNNCDLTC